MINTKINIPSNTEINSFVNELNKELAVISLEWYKGGFNKGGGRTDAGKWALRKAPQKNDLLIKTGTLRASLKLKSMSKEGFFLRASTKERGAAKEYAGYVNNGTSKMPAREFLGHSTALNKKLEKTIIKQALGWVKKLQK